MRKKSMRGFTLVELVVVIVVLAIISIGIIMFTNPVVDLWGYQNFRQGPVMEGRLALMRMVREINQLRDKQSVIAADSDTFEFVDVNNQTIEFDLDSGAVERDDVALIKGVSQLVFQYFDQNNATIGSPAVSPNDTDIRRIEIAMTVTGSGRSATVRSQAHPRNLLG